MNIRRLALGIGLVAGPLAGRVHPMHTTLTVVTVADNGALAISVRTFADDFGAAARAHSGERAVASAPQLPAESAMEAYARTGLRVANDGRMVPLAWCGARPDGDVVWLCFSAPAGTAGPSTRMLSALMFDRFDDQVNIVQVVRDGRRQSILFTKNAPAKALLR